MIYVRTVNDVDGFHQYKDAPESVAFLRNTHRHRFTIVCEFRVHESDREIEIFLQKEKIDKYLSAKYGTPCAFGNMSCESIALDITAAFSCTSCTVLEDGAGGAVVRQ